MGNFRFAHQLVEGTGPSGRLRRIMWDAVKEDMKYWPVVRGWTDMKQRAKNKSQCTAI